MSAALTGLLSACGGGTASKEEPGKSKGSPDTSTKSGTEVLYAYFPANNAQFKIGAQFNGTRKNYTEIIVSKCMAKHGFDVPVTSKSDAIASDFDNVGFPDLDRMTRTGYLNPAINIHAAGPAKQQAGYKAVLQRCTNEGTKSFNAFDRTAGPTVDQWQRIASQIELSPAVSKLANDFRACVQRAGVPSWPMNRPGASGGLGGFLNWVTGEAANTKDAQAGQAVDRRWAPVYVRCAKPVIAEEDKQRLAQQRAFFQSHYQQIREIQKDGTEALAALQKQAGE
ncbi:hypothetical protein BTM25_41250 [Actinomadura rubteroloni]|uniref:Uncharacterized protein n=2 Tax=Actinomadura rubteroloni TaxID=1926885 RepID=A0A2P4UK95_9ACTN|nr:hypothetical protein BTM25_41250 [Actinomadura rubteroloni]